MGNFRWVKSGVSLAFSGSSVTKRVTQPKTGQGWVGPIDVLPVQRVSEDRQEPLRTPLIIRGELALAS